MKSKNIVILGSGESGTGAAILTQKLGYQVFVSDKSPIKPEFKAILEKQKIEYEEGQHTIERILAADEIIKSPGIPEKTEVMKAIRAKGINVIGEIEFGFRHAGKCKILAMTGSNGKTTTTTLAHHLLKESGFDARLCGNVGFSVAKLVADDLENGKTTDPNRVFVCEISSFQLDDCQKFRPDIAVLLNITPDHLDRYDYKMENYVASKFRVTMNQRRGNLFIFNGLDAEIVNWMSSPEFKTGAKKQAIKSGFYKNGKIKIGKNIAFDMTKTALRGPHNMFNAVCALRAALALGASPEKLQLALENYVPPPHRLEKVAEIKGIEYINDSKATNVDSVFYALQAMERPVVWIVGGQDKGNDYSPLFPDVRKKVKAIVCMGVDNAKLFKVFGEFGKPMVEAKSAAEAVKLATEFAVSGDAVLLSPACASFDLFKNYEDRGQLFKLFVNKLVFNE